MTFYPMVGFGYELWKDMLNGMDEKENQAYKNRSCKIELIQSQALTENEISSLR